MQFGSIFSCKKWLLSLEESRIKKVKTSKLGQNNFFFSESNQNIDKVFWVFTKVNSAGDNFNVKF